MMDRPDADPLLLKQDLKNIQKINRWLGAYRLIDSESKIFFSSWLKNKKPSNPCHILDLCTGTADIPRFIVDWCRQRKIAVHITATDVNPQILAQAKHESRSYPEIAWDQVDALHLTYADQSFDWVICNLALHHFSTEQAIMILKQMWRMARTAIMINDLHRNYFLSVAAKLIPSSNPMTRFDAYISTRRAFTWDELFRLAFHAQISQPKIRHYFLGRQVLSAWKIG